MDSRRYVHDALYGRLQFPDYLWDLASCPEVQRLREVRLCNINSLCLTGGSNINRYEHSLGTAHLAIQTAEALKIGSSAAQSLTIAALLHDVGSAAFGHSVQYVLQQRGFEHESLDDILGITEAHQHKYSYQRARLEPIFFGMQKRIAKLLSPAVLREVCDLVKGHGTLGKLINGTLDLDNVDNVFRLAYHNGLVNSGAAPLAIARGLRLVNGELAASTELLGPIREWYEVRRRLYSYLLLNPDEFSAKCMLEEALALADAGGELAIAWFNVDYEVLKALRRSSGDAAFIVQRLMAGELYGCACILSTRTAAAYDALQGQEARRTVERKLSETLRRLKPTAFQNADIAIHAIKDVAKTQRAVTVRTPEGKVTIGESSSRCLLGVFFRNVHFTMNSIDIGLLRSARVCGRIIRVLKEELSLEELERLVPYTEACEHKESNGTLSRGHAGS